MISDERDTFANFFGFVLFMVIIVIAGRVVSNCFAEWCETPPRAGAPWEIFEAPAFTPPVMEFLACGDACEK